jgi:hypothetical protein
MFRPHPGTGAESAEAMAAAGGTAAQRQSEPTLFSSHGEEADRESPQRVAGCASPAAVPPVERQHRGARLDVGAGDGRFVSSFADLAG